MALLVAATLAAAACAGDTDDPGDTAADGSAREDPSVLGERAAPGDDPADPGGDLPALPASADDTAAVLSRVERALRSDGLTDEELSSAAHDQQVAYQALVGHPEWIDEVVANVDGSVRAAVEANARAGLELSRIGEGDAPDDLPDWVIVAPPRVDELLGYYREAEERYRIGWQYLAAIHLVETRMSRIRGDSVAGAQGPMQFIPPTWEAYGEGDVRDDRDAIIAAARYLADRGGPGDMDAALHAYNPTPHYVAAIRSYAEVMVEEPRAYRGYYDWRVYYGTSAGRYLLPEGYGAGEPAVALD